MGTNHAALEAKTTFPDGNVDRITCCRLLKTQALKDTLSGQMPRLRFNHAAGHYEPDTNTEPFTGIIAGVRADEEGSRSKERYFSARDQRNEWNVADQPPEFWNQYKTDFAPGTHVRIHPLLDWTELTFGTDPVRGSTLQSMMGLQYGIESFWSFVKRRLRKFNGVRKNTFLLYLKESEWRFNNRGNLKRSLIHLLKTYSR